MTNCPRSAGSSQNPSNGAGDDLALRTTMPPEVLIGRSLALCVHPRAAWRVLTPAKRLLLIGAYFGASYVAILTVLFGFGSKL